MKFNTPATDSVIIHYCANTFARGTDIISVRVLLDGKQVFPRGVQFNAENPTFSESNCFTWIQRRVAAGSHTVQVQHKSSGMGVTVYSNRRTLTVWHR